jgi:hypothetical protein
MKSKGKFKLTEKEGATNVKRNESFYRNFGESIFLALLEQKKLTSTQYEKCMEILNRQKYRY